jgi:hypothetical protein
MADAQWRSYEKAIQGIFSQIKGAKVRSDVVVKGRSGRSRKLELLITYPLRINFAPEFEFRIPIRIAVDCKHHERPVNINLVGQFADQMDDIGASIGLMVATGGFDAGAKRRAKLKNIYLLQAGWDLVVLRRAFGERDFHFCEECAANREEKDRPPAVAHWGTPEDPLGVVWAHCDWCNSVHALCPDCGEVTGMNDGDLGELIQCRGACGRVYQVESSAEGDDYASLSDEQVNILKAAAESATGFTVRNANQVLRRTKWRYAKRKLWPLQDLERHEWVTIAWKPEVSDSVIELEDKATEFLDDLPNARSAHYGW